MRTQDDVIRKVAALKRLAAGAGTPEEAAAAAAKAQELMFAHNIQEVQLDARRATADDLYVDEHGIEAVGVWRQHLLNGIARTNFCRAVYSFGGRDGERRSPRVSLVGTRENVDHVLGLWRWLISELEHMAARAWSGEQASGESGRTWKNGYYHGAVFAILRRLRAQRAADERRVESVSTALVVIEQGVEKALSRFYPTASFKRDSGRRSVSRGAFLAGQRDGDAMPLDRTAKVA